MNVERWTFYVFQAFVCLLLISALPVCAQDDESNKVTLSADNTRWYADDKVTATGNVKAVYQDYTITADSAEADLQTNIAVFKGSVKLVSDQATVEGQDLTVNLKTREWSLQNAGTQVGAPAMQQGEVRLGTGAPVFIHSESLRGSPSEVIVSGGSLTTCDLDHPHYVFSARELDIYPEKKIIARKVSMMGLDRKLFSLPTLVIPIRGMKYNLLPQVGSSAEEGTFIKTSYAYSATDHSQGFAKLDLMQRRGIGLGLDHTLNSSSATSQASLYFLADRQIGGNNITGYLRHQQKFGAIDLNLTGNYRTNSYLYYPSSTAQDWQAVLSRVTGKSNTALTYRTSKSSGFGTSTTDNTSLRHTQQFGKKLSGIVSMDMRKYLSSGMTAADQELDADIELRHREDKFDLALITSKRFDLDNDDYTGDEFFSSLDRLPELTFATDSYRLGEKSFFGLPSRMQLSYGRFHEMPSGITSDRYLIQWDMLGRNYDLSDRNELNVSAGFRQAYYASDMMQYVLKANSTLTTRFNDYLKSRVSYYYQRPEGFSPFRFDYTGKYNYSRANLEYQDDQKLRWTLSSGYNFTQTDYPWQDISLRLTARPNPYLAYALSGGYDINRSKWRNLVTQVRLLNGDRIGLDLGARYDIETGKLGLARTRFDFDLGKLWRIEGITSWNGITKQFDYKAFRLTRDLHCWEASIVYSDETGFRNDKGVSLEFKIKAFPTQDRFGIGQYGQAIDTSMGDYFY